MKLNELHVLCEILQLRLGSIQIMESSVITLCDDDVVIRGKLLDICGGEDLCPAWSVEMRIIAVRVFIPLLSSTSSRLSEATPSPSSEKACTRDGAELVSSMLLAGHGCTVPWLCLAWSTEIRIIAIRIFIPTIVFDVLEDI